jgi:hypothetical protein
MDRVLGEEGKPDVGVTRRWRRKDIDRGDAQGAVGLLV